MHGGPAWILGGATGRLAQGIGICMVKTRGLEPNMAPKRTWNGWILGGEGEEGPLGKWVGIPLNPGLVGFLAAAAP